MKEIEEETLATFLSQFRTAPRGFRPETLSERLGLGVGELESIRERLAADGFVFETDDEGRWSLARSPDRLLPYWIRAGLRCDRLGGQVYYKDEVVSTQDIAFELMVEGRPHGTLVLAEHQSGGRGRGENVWYSTPGKSLQFSLLLDLEPPDTFASVLTIAIATAVARAIQDVAGLPARIKFPNDILVRGKKVAGILLEVKDYGVPTRRAVAGVGINVNQLRDELPDDVRAIATTLREEVPDHEPIRRSRLLRYMLRELEQSLDRIAQADFTALEDAWNRFSPMEGKDVTLTKGAEKFEGRVLEANIREGLLMRLANGSRERIRLEHITDLTVPNP
jgi:BirA family biotin operon repressor/biotin-[acetyl-CoA-carboxylase] ligase